MFKLLTTFIAVYERRSFSQAAQDLFISQPTVSTQIHQLETDLGVQLFVRDGRKTIIATPAGDTCYQRAQQLLAQWQQTEQDVRTVSQQRLPFRFGASQTTATSVVPDVLPDLATAFPRLDWQLHVANSEAIVAAVRHQQLDLGLIEKPLTATDVHRDPFGGDTLSHVGQANGPWLVREAGSGVGYYTRRYWADHDLSPERIIEVDNSGVLLALLAQGFGQSLVSQQTIPAGVPIHHDQVQSRQFYLLTAQAPSAIVTQVVQRLLA